MLAGKSTSNKVIEFLNHPGNVMNLQTDAHKDYDKLSWGIEAKKHDGTVRVNLNKKLSCC